MRAALLSIIVSGILVGASFAQAGPESALAQFNQAQAFYRQGSYEEAVKAYEAVRKSGYESGALNFNLGNAYFKLGQLGKAVLNYERARRILPRDPDVLSNYRYALSSAGTETLEQNFIERLVEDQVNFYTIDELLIICLAVFAAMAAFSLLGLYLKWDDRRRFIVVSLLLAVFVFYAGLFYLKYKLDENQAVVVTKTEARFEPLADSTVYFDLAQGSSVRIIRNELAWSKIVRKDGRLGWVQTEHLERIE